MSGIKKIENAIMKMYDGKGPFVEATYGPFSGKILSKEVVILVDEKAEKIHLIQPEDLKLYENAPIEIEIRHGKNLSLNILKNSRLVDENAELSEIYSMLNSVKWL